MPFSKYMAYPEVAIPGQSPALFSRLYETWIEARASDPRARSTALFAAKAAPPVP